MAPHCCAAMIGPSVLDCDMVERVLKAGADYVHLDVMDGHFVPNISFGPYVIECLRRHVPDIPFDCHMMTSEPENWVAGVAKAQGSKPGLLTYTFHLETTEERGNTQQVIDDIKSHGMRVGLGISPDTPVETLLKYGDQIDLALIMTVHPGKGGQSFMENMMSKVRKVRELYPEMDIEVDGGVKPATIDAAAEAGANLIVSGSGVYKASDMAESISTMRRSVEKLGQGKEDGDLTPMRSDKD
ncbi:Ribulose-phosphate 3-epimerase [Hondaea fermentalgiana]|uniref:Ribulose-phosphate 3-epimerase n=1 Tax=Hondaea fermentalgiana TaxID=2315210 RepID=A0A2R5G9M3_9STRA|nr:Ribulose-phosphate 3-epimerase [Hondaea fermentalgiana]|eukprot:GBG27009.1 Ribulose-phosphate 3-epimerase [Hondaea fermentalgiana]